MIDELEAMLVAITGYDAVSLQPNAGSQGELAGLLAIRAYHRSRGDHQRTVCLIPSSAHGTNAASARHGRHGRRGGGLRRPRQRRPRRPAGQGAEPPASAWPRSWSPTRRPTACSRPASPSCAPSSTTHGGQVYVDGANLNALVGVAQPGRFGADVSHLNLHKTFCIPHGGGGPGVGPVAVRGAPGAVPAQPPAAADGPGRAGVGGAVRLGRHPRHLVGVHRADGRRRPAGGHRRRRAERQLHRPPPRRRLPGALHGRARRRRPRVHPRPAAASPRPPASPSTTWPSG